jgi:hypothetical protein
MALMVNGFNWGNGGNAAVVGNGGVDSRKMQSRSQQHTKN